MSAIALICVTSIAWGQQPPSLKERLTSLSAEIQTAASTVDCKQQDKDCELVVQKTFNKKFKSRVDAILTEAAKPGVKFTLAAPPNPKSPDDLKKLSATLAEMASAL